MSRLLTKNRESDVTFHGGRVVPRSTGITSCIGRFNVPCVYSLVRALRIQNEVALSARPRIRTVVFEPETGPTKFMNELAHQILN